MKYLENITKFLPLGSLFVILCSSVKLVIYYKIFNISIVEFLGIEEYITLFIDDLLYYVMIFGVGVLLYIFNTDFSNNIITIRQDFSEFKTKRVVVQILMVAFVIIIPIYIYHLDKNSFKIQGIGLGIFIFFNLLHVYSSVSKIRFPYPVLIICSLFLYTIIGAFVDAQKIFDDENKIMYNIEINNLKIQTNDDLHYLGKSEKYIFFYSIKKSETKIFSFENLKMTLIKGQLTESN